MYCNSIFVFSQTYGIIADLGLMNVLLSFLQ